MHGHVGVGVGRVAQRLAQALVDLHHVHVADTLSEVLREHAQAPADLQHDIGAVQLGGTVDHAEDVRVDQEVLPQLAVGAHGELAHPSQARLDGSIGHGAHPQPNTRDALRSTVALSCCVETPRSSARKATV